MPLGTVGEVTYEDLWPDPAKMGAAVRALLGPSTPPPADVDIDLGDGLRLIGWLRSVGPKGQVLHRYSMLRGKTELDAWIRHLAMLASCGGRKAETHILARGQVGLLHKRLVPVKRPEKYLRELLDLYHLGQRVPLPLFPDPASVYVEKLMLHKPPEQGSTPRGGSTSRTGTGSRTLTS
jgi:exonuclease V gamma subunit